MAVGATGDYGLVDAVPGLPLQEQADLVKAAKQQILRATPENLTALRDANDALHGRS